MGRCTRRWPRRASRSPRWARRWDPTGEVDPARRQPRPLPGAPVEPAARRRRSAAPARLRDARWTGSPGTRCDALAGDARPRARARRLSGGVAAPGRVGHPRALPRRSHDRAEHRAPGRGRHAAHRGRRPGSGPAAAEDYEAILTPDLRLASRGGPGRGARTRERAAGRVGPGLAGADRAAGRRGAPRTRSIAAAWPLLIAALNRAGLGPLRAEVSGPALRRSGLRGIDEVCARLGVTAGYVHLRPHPPRRPAARQRRGRVGHAPGSRLINSGCWVHEPAFMGPDASQSPYRTGLLRRRRRRRPAAPAQSAQIADPARPGVKQTAWQVTPSPTSRSSSPAVLTGWAISS